jgi:nickel transport protein
MVDGGSKAAQAGCSLLVSTLFLLCPTSAFAHKLYVFAQLEGAMIHGRAYFPGDVPARMSDVIARDVSGRELGRTTTDNEGKFTFTAREHVDYYLVAITPDGHSGQYTIHASELPGSLPADVPTAGGGSQVASRVTDRSGLPAAAAGKENELSAVRAELADLRGQIGELQWQVLKSDERLRFRDILGGIGFILGLAGVASYMMARRSKT